MNNKYGLGTLYFAGLVTATTLLLSAEAKPQSKEYADKAIVIVKQHGEKTINNFGTIYAMALTPIQGNPISQISFQESDSSKGMLSAAYIDMKNNVVNIMDYGATQPDGKADGKPDGQADLYMVIKMSEDGCTKPVLVDGGQPCETMQSVYSQSIERIIGESK